MPLFSYDFTEFTWIYRRVIRNLIYVRTTSALRMVKVAGELYPSALAKEAALLHSQGVFRVWWRARCERDAIWVSWCKGNVNEACGTFKWRSPAWPVLCGFLVCQAGGIFSFSQFSWKQRPPYPCRELVRADISLFPAGVSSAVRVLHATEEAERFLLMAFCLPSSKENE